MISESHYLSLLLDLGMDAEEMEYLENGIATRKILMDGGIVSAWEPR